jgi:hypothetical protein
MVLGFKQRFVAPILAGTKIHTIRPDIHDRWRSGNSIQMATGVRTKEYHQFNKGRPGLLTCISRQKIEICYGGILPVIRIDGRPMFAETIEQLCYNDGFENMREFYAWFNKSFTGKIIHWTNFKY